MAAGQEPWPVELMGPLIKPVLLSWESLNDKAMFLRRESVRDASLPAVRLVAARFARILDPLARAEAIHRFVRDSIRYVRDLGGEEFADCAVILARGFDDCDGKARLVVALTLAAERLCPVGLFARIVPVFPSPDVFAHVAAAFRWTNSATHPRALDGWVRSETILADCPLGAGTEAAKRDDAGRILFA